MGALWFLLVGVLLIAVALLGRFLDRLPVSLAMIYLVVGFILGPAVTNALELHPMRHLEMLRSITEVALLIALFTVGIKLRVPVGDWRWACPAAGDGLHAVDHRGSGGRGVSAAGPRPGQALLLGAILAPTDPVLASDVQLRSPRIATPCASRSPARAASTMARLFRWCCWASGCWGCTTSAPWPALAGRRRGVGHGGRARHGLPGGMAVARGVRWLRARRSDAVMFDEFLLLGVIALSYGVALAANTLGFLAVFAAGLALRRADDIHASSMQAADKPPLTPSMLNVNEQLERIVEVAIVLLVGAMISTGYWSAQDCCWPRC